MNAIRVALLVLGLSLNAAFAQAAARTFNYDLPAQPMISALNAFASQSDLRVVFDATAMQDLRSGAVQGAFTPDSALKLLLNASGFTFQFPDATTVEVRPAAASEGQANATERANAPRLADASAVVSADEKNSTSGMTPVVSTGETPAAAPPAPKGIPEILVRGARTLNTAIERTEDDIQPYVVFRAEEIQQSQATNLEGFFRTRLPMNTTYASSTQAATALDGNKSSVSLRGLGPDQTLILLNGRRLPSVQTGSSFTQPDMNGIPLNSIERIEILPATSSGQFGGGATGGVINIITRRDYEGAELNAVYGDTFDGDAANRRFNLNGGFHFAGGKTQVSYGASYGTSDPLSAGDRDFAARARDAQLRNNPTAFVTLGIPPLGSTPNIQNSSSANLVLKPAYGGATLSSSYTSVPSGFRGIATDGVSGLVARAGTYDLAIPNDQNGNARYLLGDTKLLSGTASIRHQFSDAIEAYIDTRWSKNENRSAALPVAPYSVLLPSAPENPFTTPVLVSFPVPNVSRFTTSEISTALAAGGFVIRLPHQWSAGLDYSWGRSKSELRQASPVFSDSLSTGINDGSLNIVSDVAQFPLDYSSTLLPADNRVGGPTEIVSKNATLRFSGPLAQLPGGPLTLSTVLERREENGLKFFQLGMTGAGATTFQFYPERSQDVNSFYLETTAPLVGPSAQIPFLRELQLMVSARRDSYETKSPSPSSPSVPSAAGPFPAVTENKNSFDATKYTFGFRIAPVQDVAIRASIGTGFLPPSVNQILSPTTLNFPNTVIDPKRGSVSASTGVIGNILGGNPNLVPEDSRSISTGIIVTPRALPDLRFSVDYTRIKKKSEINQSISIQQLLFIEDLLPGRVTRNPLTPADAALGYTGGRITSVNLSALNVTKAVIEAYDFKADYSLKGFRFFAVATYQPTLFRQTIPAVAGTNTAGYEGPVKWRGNAGVTWTDRSLTLGWNAQYFAPQHIYASNASPATIAAFTLNQGSSTYPSQFYNDAFVEYRFRDANRSLLENLTVSFTVLNVFDRQPPVVVSTSSTEGYLLSGDPRQRRFSLSVTKAF